MQYKNIEIFDIEAFLATLPPEPECGPVFRPQAHGESALHRGNVRDGGQAREQVIALYARRALGEECRKVSSAIAERNKQLNRSSFCLGRLVGAQVLERWEVEVALLSAARACGLPQKESEATIKSGLNAGEQNPRDLSQVGLRAGLPRGFPVLPACAGIAPQQRPKAEDGNPGNPGEGSPGEGSSPVPTETNLPYLAPGTWVKALDRDNFGTVEEDRGEEALVHFVSPEGHEATVTLPKSILIPLNSEPAFPEDDPGFVGFVSDPPEPQPIRVDLRPVPELIPEMVPLALRGWLTDIARRMGCPLVYPVVGAIISLAVLVGRKVAIRPKCEDDWAVVPNLWGGIVGRPGLMKTPALEQAMGPLKRLAEAAQNQFAAAMCLHKTSVLLAKAKRDALKDELKKAARKGATEEELAALAAQTSAETEEPKLKRYIINDSSIEKLGEIHRDNPVGLMLFRDELTGLLRTLDKPGHETDRSFLLEGWNGTGSFTYDRIGRGTVVIPAVCLSILGGIQPGPLARFMRRATQGTGEQDDGLIPRFQVLVYPDPPDHWEIIDEPPDAGAQERANWIFESLDTLGPARYGATIGAQGEIPFYRFSGEAQAFFYEWWADLEQKVRSGQESPALESHLCKYRSLMPALALLFHLVAIVDGGVAGPVSLDAAELAAAWCDFLEEHARRIHEAGNEGDPEPSRQLAERIRKGKVPDPFRARDIVRKGWASLDSYEELGRAIALLEDLGWLYGVEVPSTRSGGRPTSEYHINPRVLGAGS
jgi:putative DNA primase/helicase